MFLLFHIETSTLTCLRGERPPEAFVLSFFMLPLFVLHDGTPPREFRLPDFGVCVHYCNTQNKFSIPDNIPAHHGSSLAIHTEPDPLIGMCDPITEFISSKLATLISIEYFRCAVLLGGRL